MQKEAGMRWSNSDQSSIAHKRCINLLNISDMRRLMPLADNHILSNPFFLTHKQHVSTCKALIVNAEIACERVASSTLN